MIEIYWFDHLFVGIATVLMTGAVQQQGALKNRQFTEDDKRSMYLLNAAALWVVCLICLAIWRLGGRTPGQIGLAMPEHGHAAGLLLAGAVFLLWCADMWYQTRPERIESSRREWRIHTPFMPATFRGALHFIPLAITAGVTEEIVFRGYLVRYFQSLFRGVEWSDWIAVALPAIAFAIGHRYQKRAAVLKILMLAIGFGIVFVATGSLLWCIVVHSVIDLAAGFVSPGLMHTESESAATATDPVSLPVEAAREPQEDSPAPPAPVSSLPEAPESRPDTPAV